VLLLIINDTDDWFCIRWIEDVPNLGGFDAFECQSIVNVMIGQVNCVIFYFNKDALKGGRVNEVELRVDALEPVFDCGFKKISLTDAEALEHDIPEVLFRLAAV
jgi:hypothetical protein